MIARLKGLVDGLGEDWLILDVGGVGYLVFASARTLRDCRQGEAATLEVETHVREDHIHLYGFKDAAEKQHFALLTSVKGVGAKVALAILSVLEPKQLVDAIMLGDKGAVTRANGVGPKLALRIVNELAEAVGKLPAVESVTATVTTAGADAGGDVRRDALSALTNLGYRPVDAQGAIAKVAATQGVDAGLDTLIRLSLKELAR